MKKLMYATMLAVMLLSLSFAVVGADFDFEDPKLCVNGEWLLVIAAHPQGVQVALPRDAKYGDQRAGGCKTPGPNVPLITNVVRHGERNVMVVQVNGKLASQPVVKASYDGQNRIERNNGKRMIKFVFRLDH
jgi:hypothetical protein